MGTIVSEKITLWGLVLSLFSSPDGDLSSKRVFGAAMVAFGITWAAIGSWKGNAMMVAFGTNTMITGGTVLGVSVFEHLKKGA